ncbi:diguanylate cyclase [Alisedimentitalea sp. MJ-SS2]|uniref:diguanylate cyclase domain-containing protein n=1 Tax=Aliisedimentitalea sp. MJ-SS2 TaxID=3049795 RepID=UPI0029145484|nr:diguanylate cyclase [Alisedimentitalea sp. MJ-SS2]MDU8927126.1 diguanylate cyclase [Alisedimentitalea sp. MJ-SS2]
MPGKVLIVDTIATNRVVMKVKLAKACYQVVQATTGVSGLQAARQLRPDLVICAGHLPDMTAAEFAAALRQNSQTRATSLLVETVERDPDFRYGILAAGADDILLKPYANHLLLARMRSLLRHRETAEDLTLREGANRALGLSEDPEQFAHPDRVAVIGPNARCAVAWRYKLERALPGAFTALHFKDALRHLAEAPPPEAVALILSPDTVEPGLQLLADLRAKPDTRHAGILVLIEEGSVAPEKIERLASDALDRGASGVMTEGFQPREIALRLHRQVTRKRTLERLRADMRDGLRAALTDPLTGLYNRRHAMPHMRAIADRAAQTGSDFAAMVIDVDYFKAINDRFGHAAGDTVLMRLARLLEKSAGRDDLVARIGGEEFLIVMPDTTRSAAQMAAKRICRAVRDTGFPVNTHAQPLRVTVSIGVALASDLAAGATVPALHQRVLDQADKALYGAKAHGRNQVTLSDARSAA